MAIRLIARLDIKGPDLIKPVNLEGVRRVGKPKHFARRYYEEGIDEILYMDAVASLYGRNSLTGLLQETVAEIFVPITAGGGVRSPKDVDALLRAGADKVAINSAAIRDPGLIERVARRFGSQCTVLSIEAKRRDGGFEAYVDGGRERSGREVVAWAREGVARGAGEILLTSVDAEGTRGGFDLELTRRVTEAVDVPVIVSGGMGRLEHLDRLLVEGAADAVAMAHVLHYDLLGVGELAAHLRTKGLRSR